MNALIALLALLVQSGAVHAPAPTARPNFVVILGEGHGWSSTSVDMDGADPRDAQPAGLTPQLERLAADGMRFSAFYASCPRCTPSRASFLTGISPAKLHMTYVNEGGSNKRNKRGAESADDETPRASTKVVPPHPDSELPAGAKTTGDALRELGYATAHFGKWHVGRADPTRHGFDVADGANTNQGPERGVNPNPKQATVISERAIEFMRDAVKAGKPFFVQIDHYGAGSEDEVTPESLAETKALLPKAKAKQLATAAGVRDMDKAIGGVLAAINEMGLAGNTFVVFSTDHGTPGGGGKSGGVNAPLAGGKGSVREGGVRVPFIVRGPGIERGAVSGVRASGMDLLPTLRDLAGHPLPRPERPDDTFVVEGGSLAGVLLHGGVGGVDRPREEFVIHYPHEDLDNGGPASAIYLGEFKLIRNYETGKVSLFDIAKDRGESNDLAASMPEKAKDLETRLDAYLKAVNAQMPTPAPAPETSR
ncbi:MAG: sulfatase-like hydrolase/transferase [Phycisphaerales bacterium]